MDALRIGAPRARLRVTAFALLFFTLSVGHIFRFAPLRTPLTADNQFFFFIAERAASGVPPHISFFLPRTEMATLATGGAIRIARWLGGEDLVAARLLSIAVTGAVVALVWLATFDLGGSFLAAHVAALGMMSLGSFLGKGAMGVESKVFMCLFLLLTLLAANRRRPFLAGISSGLAFMCWQATLLVSVTALAVFMFEPRRARSAIAYGGGVFAALLPFELYYLAHGALEEQLFQVFYYPAQFLTHSLSTRAVVEHLGSYLRLDGGLRLQSLLPMLLLVAILVGWILPLVRTRLVLDALRARPAWIYLFLGSQAALFFTLYDFQGLPDLFLTAPFMAVASGLLIGLPTAHLRRKIPRVAWSILATLVVALAVVHVEQNPLPRYRKELTVQKRLAARIQKLTADGLSVYALGCVHLLAFAHRDNYLPYGHGFRTLRKYFSWRHGDTWAPTRNGKLPDVVLHSRGSIPGTRRWLRQNYHQVGDAEFAADRTKVYVLDAARIAPE